MTQPRRPELIEQTDKVETPFPHPFTIGTPPAGVRSVRALRAPTLADAAPSGLSQAQIVEYQRRLARGFYASPAVVREVARRILESSDM